MEKQQKLEWAEAQKIVVNVNLVAAAKQQLRFLAAVDRNRGLYQGSVLKHAVHRYKFCWLPLLAKQAEIAVFPLVAPLDCEWVWHCHRLNPLRYKADCEELYGRVLDTVNVVSSVESDSTKQTEEIWNCLYPNEPYVMDLNSPFDGAVDSIASDSKSTNYDLLSAVKRQSTFFYQVSRPHMSNEEYLEGSVARYKGFLYLIKKNIKNNYSKSFCVPTFDIDLIWHTHQLHPAAYCEDTIALFGKVLEHDDMDSDRSEGSKLNVGFTNTTKEWEESFGLSYGRAGARYRGPAPTPVMIDSFMSGNPCKKMRKSCQNMVKLPKEYLVEVLMEIVGVRLSPENPGEKLYLCLSKKDDTKQKLRISFDSKEKQGVALQCEPNGILILELVSNLPNSKVTKVLGTACLALPQCKLTEDRFVELTPPSRNASETPTVLHISLSLTPPMAAPYVLVMAPLVTSKESCRISMDGGWMCVMDKVGSLVIGIQIKGRSKKEVIGISGFGERQTLAVSEGDEWSLMDLEWSLDLEKKTSNYGRFYELIGERKVMIIPGRKLEYEMKPFGTQRNEQCYMTAVEISPEDPNGKAIGLFDLRSCALEVKEEWFLLPGIISACVLSTTLESNNEDLDKGNDLLNHINGNEFMAFCQGTACGVGSCGTVCRGGCQSGGCQTRCNGK